MMFDFPELAQFISVDDLKLVRLPKRLRRKMGRAFRRGVIVKNQAPRFLVTKRLALALMNNG
jgi:hypothetical protein